MGERWRGLDCEAAIGKTEFPGGAAASVQGKPSLALLCQDQSNASGRTAKQTSWCLENKGVVGRLCAMNEKYRSCNGKNMKRAYVCTVLLKGACSLMVVFSTDIWINLFKFITEYDSNSSMNRKTRLRTKFTNKLQNNILKF